jgi:TATA element modulatory factor
LSEYQQREESNQAQLESWRKRAETAEAAFLQAKAEAEKQDSWKAERPESLEKERRSWLEDTHGPSSRNHSRPDSPLLSMPLRAFSHDALALQGPLKSRKASSPSSIADGLGDGPPLRLPNLPLTSGISPTIIQSPFDSHVDLNSTPSLAAGEKDDLFEGVEEGVDLASSPRQMMQDVMSVSTVAAGPSVQLVERMSAAIRRLEGEKMAAREELARISSQRDEARAEIAALMRECRQFGG